jgi:hypothetical protein
MTTLIQGDGVAAWCCGLLLRRAGVEVRIRPARRSRLPAILLSDAALALMRDVFGAPELLRDCPRIVRRVVLWGGQAEPAQLDHGAVVVSEDRLRQALATEDPDGRGGEAADWSVIASRPLPVEISEQSFGSRSATAVPVELNGTAEPAACWMESLAGGWLFAVTEAPGAGWLLGVGAPPEELLAGSRLLAPRIAAIGEPTGAFPAAPRIVSPLSGPGWLACGSAAMAFDPICGDGTAHAIREAILAAAVIRAAAQGGDEASLRAHYEGRLRSGFRRHLDMCLAYYRSGGAGDWWRGEAEMLRRGIEWCGPDPAFRYRLSGFDLEPAGAP